MQRDEGRFSPSLRLSFPLSGCSSYSRSASAGTTLLRRCLRGGVQELLEAAMDVIGCREVFELLVERDEAGAIELQRIGCGQLAIEDIVVLHGAALGKEDDSLLRSVLFQRGVCRACSSSGAGEDNLADGAPRIGVDVQCAAKGKGLDVFMARVFNVDLSRADAIRGILCPGMHDVQPASIRWPWRSRQVTDSGSKCSPVGVGRITTSSCGWPRSCAISGG